MADLQRIPGTEYLGPPLPGDGPIDGVMEWRSTVYVAQQGCIWMLKDDAWVLAIDAVAPPGFPTTWKEPSE